MEGSGGDSKSPFHILHHLPRRPPWFQGRSRHRDRHPQGQAAPLACGLEGGVPLRDIPGPDQSVRRLGQIQVTGDPEGLRRRPKRLETNDKLLAPPDRGGQSGGLLWNGIQRGVRRDAGRPAVHHHIQCGSGRGRPALGERDRGIGGGKEGNGTGGPTPGCTFIRRQRHSRLVRPRLAPGRFYRPGMRL